MKSMIATLGAALFLAGCACEDNNPATVMCTPSYDKNFNRMKLVRYGHLYPTCPTSTNTEVAVAHRAMAFKRTQDLAAFESGFYGSTVARPSGRISDYLAPCPPPGGVMIPVTPELAPPIPLPPAPIAEAPLGECVPGKPGFVISPYSPNAGYVDVNGMAPGSLAKDPFSGKMFRIP